jgi:hypothetical protein
MLRAWRLIASAPLDTAIDVAVIDRDGLHLLTVPVLRTDDGWVNAETGSTLDIRPTHWRSLRRGEEAAEHPAG